MSPVKKILFGLFVAIALGLGTWAYFNVKNSKKPGVEALSVLPDSCLVYFHSGNFFELNKKLNAQSLIIDRLKLVKDVGAFCTTLRLFDSLFRSNPLLEEELRGNSIHFALYGHRPDWLAAFNIKRLGAQEQVSEAIRRLFRAREAEPGVLVFELHRNIFYFHLSSGVALLTCNKALLYSASQSSGAKLEQNKRFTEFKNTLEEQALLSVYVDHAAYRNSGLTGRLNLCAESDAGFSAGAVEVQPSEVKVNGYFVPADTTLAAALLEQQPQSTDFTGLLPVHTTAFKAYGISSLRGLIARLHKASGAINPAFWKPINDTALYDLEEEFYLNAEHCLVDFETSAPDGHFVLLQIADTAMAQEHLQAMSDSVEALNADSLYRLRSNPAGDLKLLAPLARGITRYAARRGSCLYFAEDRNSLTHLLQTFHNGELLALDESFIAYKAQNFYENFNYLAYCVPNRARKDIHRFFNFELSGKKDPFENFRHFSFLLERQGGRFRFRCQLAHETEKTGKDRNTLWSLRLDTLSFMKASPFVNHHTKENELLLQDDNHTLYLVNAKGTLLWKKRLDEKISSDIFIVDAFKNNKYQILFSSKNYLHLLDRNGAYVPGYPAKLPAEASAALSVFDYDNTRDYRLFIACKNRLIYNYSLAGTKQAGFVPYRTDEEVKLPVQYVKVGLSDYLVAVDTEGKIYTFSRRGDGRIGLRNKTVANCSGFYLDASGNINSTYLVYVDDKNSSINKISFTDKKELVKLNNTVEGADISFGQADAGKIMSVIFTRPNAVLVYDLNGNLLQNKLLDKDLCDTRFYRDERGTVFLTRSAIRQELYLFRPPAAQMQTFQASAAPLITDLFNDHKKYLLITQRNRLSCVVLN